jgi:aspartyl-tRNA(Asn)/glutamyl-tRNA(Gln) amidotransferase subunit B
MLLTSTREIADFYEATAKAAGNTRAAANWITSELLARMKVDDLQNSPVSPAALGEMIKLIDDGTISGKMAKEIFDQMFKTGKSAAVLVKEMGGGQISDASQLETIIADAITANPKQAADYRAGKQALLAFFVGQVMKVTKGKANPQLVNDILKAKLAE